MIPTEWIAFGLVVGTALAVLEAMTWCARKLGTWVKNLR